MASLKNLLKSFGAGVAALVAPDTVTAVQVISVTTGNVLLSAVAPCDGWACLYADQSTPKPVFLNLRINSFWQGTPLWDSGSTSFGAVIIPIRKGQRIDYVANGVAQPNKVYLSIYKNSA